MLWQIETRVWAVFGMIAMAHTATAGSLSGRIGNRATFESPSPVTVLTAEDIDTGAIVDATELLQMTQTSVGITNKGAVVNLRGLDANARTLVLVNGKRRLASPNSYQFVNTLPANAIRRIEICKDGSSAVYGSDAVAGVVETIVSGGHRRGGLAREVGQTLVNPAVEFNTDLRGSGYGVQGEFCVDVGASLPLTFGVGFSGYDLSGRDTLDPASFSDGLGVTGIGGVPGVYIGYPTDLTYGGHRIDRTGREFSLDLTIPIRGTIRPGDDGPPESWKSRMPTTVSQTSYIGGVRFGSLDQDEWSGFETYTPSFGQNGAASIDYWSKFDGNYFGAYGGLSYSRTYLKVGGGDVTLSLAGTVGFNRYSFDVQEDVDAFGLGNQLNYSNTADYSFDDMLPTARLALGLDYSRGNLIVGGFIGLEAGTIPEINRHLPDSDLLGALDAEYDLSSTLSRRVGLYVNYRF